MTRLDEQKMSHSALWHLSPAPFVVLLAPHQKQLAETTSTSTTTTTASR